MILSGVTLLDEIGLQLWIPTCSQSTSATVLSYRQEGGPFPSQHTF